MTAEDYRHFEEPPAPPPRPRKASASEWAAHIRKQLGWTHDDEEATDAPA